MPLIKESKHKDMIIAGINYKHTGTIPPTIAKHLEMASTIHGQRLYIESKHNDMIKAGINKHTGAISPTITKYLEMNNTM